MLVLSRDCDTVIRIGPDIRVKVLSIRKQRVKIGVDAPENVRVWREEISPFADDRQVPHVDEPDEASVIRAVEDDFSILVVEDDPDHARLITKVLTDCRFPQVTLAKTGEAAIQALGDVNGRVGESLAPHLVLLDLQLPDMSGVDVLRRIRSDERYHTTPVVMLSAAREDTVVADCLEAGANAFVNKSAHFKEFRDSVTRIANFWKTDCRILRARQKVAT
jgi:carbon storage regulator CsrA